MARKPKQPSKQIILDLIQGAQESRDKKIVQYQKAIEDEKAKSESLKAKLTAAQNDDDLQAYQKAREEIRLSESAIEFYTSKLAKTKEQVLGDLQLDALLRDIHILENTIENEALAKFEPQLRNILNELEKVHEEIKELAQAEQIVFVAKGSNQLPYRANDLLDMIRGLADIFNVIEYKNTHR